MKYKYVFLLGRPGCGKSALYRELEKRILESAQAETCERVDDFPKVWALLQRDDALEQEGKERLHSRRSENGGWLFTNDQVWDDFLKEVNAEVLEIDRPDHVIFIEFARPSYIGAIRNFDRGILDDCIAIYMQVSFETCWARNVARHEGVIGEDGDDHFVRREAMEKFYLHDDQEAFVQQMQERNIPVVVVDNEADGEEHLQSQVEELFRSLF
jgi:hypothetical protein